jgi:hypothetical protein
MSEHTYTHTNTCNMKKWNGMPFIHGKVYPKETYIPGYEHTCVEISLVYVQALVMLQFQSMHAYPSRYTCTMLAEAAVLYKTPKDIIR